MLPFLNKFTAPKKIARKHPPLHLFNTLSGTIEEFTPLVEDYVSMYNCGPTVYDEQHIGNLYSQIFANTLRRTLDAFGYQVDQVVNITDVGHLTGDNAGDADTGVDRMEAAAAKAHVSAQEIAGKVTEQYFKDLDALGIDRSKIRFPKATEYIGEQIALVQALQEKGYAYLISDGVYYDTAKFSGYGKLGNILPATADSVGRIEENKEKHNPSDFALWKLSKPEEKRQQEWDSPWGVGFPGWHIECTAMIFKLLGRQIDIHTGGVDHIPVHHNNEIAQAEAISGKQYVDYWMHNAHITIEGKKISKSLGNTVYLRQIVDRGFSARSLRMWALGGHYRTPMNFTWDAIEGANTSLNRLTKYFFEDLKKAQGKEYTSTFMKDFIEAMGNDLDTAKALARVYALVKDETLTESHKREALIFADSILGLGFTDAGNARKMAVAQHHELPQAVRDLLAERKAAREAKDFEKSDDLRKRLEALGYVVQDTAEGQDLTQK